MKRNYSIWDEMYRMQEQMDSMFDNFFSGSPFRTQNLLEDSSSNGNIVNCNYKQPISDIYETDSEVIAEVEIPGINKDDIKVHVSDKGIEIKAETKNEVEQEDKKKGMYRCERNYSGFSRFFSLPNNIDPDKADAEYKDGILKVKVPKLEIEKQEKKLLDIK